MNRILFVAALAILSVSVAMPASANQNAGVTMEVAPTPVLEKIADPAAPAVTEAVKETVTPKVEEPKTEEVKKEEAVKTVDKVESEKAKPKHKKTRKHKSKQHAKEEIQNPVTKPEAQ